MTIKARSITEGYRVFLDDVPTEIPFTLNDGESHVLVVFDSINHRYVGASSEIVGFRMGKGGLIATEYIGSLGYPPITRHKGIEFEGY